MSDDPITALRLRQLRRELGMIIDNQPSEARARLNRRFPRILSIHGSQPKPGPDLDADSGSGSGSWKRIVIGTLVLAPLYFLVEEFAGEPLPWYAVVVAVLAMCGGFFLISRWFVPRARRPVQIDLQDVLDEVRDNLKALPVAAKRQLRERFPELGTPPGTATEAGAENATEGVEP